MSQRAKIATVRHFSDHFLTHAAGLSATDVAGSDGVLALAEELF